MVYPGILVEMGSDLKSLVLRRFRSATTQCLWGFTFSLAGKCEVCFLCKNMLCQPLQSGAGRGPCNKTAPWHRVIISGSCIQSTGLQDLGELSVKFTGEELVPGRVTSDGTKKVGWVGRALIDPDSFLVEKILKCYKGTF